jgi:glutathione synthase/RimK-type ligase-like ATP-grasp enzyme
MTLVGHRNRQKVRCSVQIFLATSADWPDGEPGAAALDQALATRGVTARWMCWDDPAVDWASAPLVAARSTWDYDTRLPEFLAWADSLGSRLLNGAAVFRWNTDKSYLCDLADAGVPVVPTRSVLRVEDLGAAIAEFGEAVVKPAIGAGGRGIDIARAGAPYTPVGRGPWVVQPLVETVRTLGETSVFVLGGRATSQVHKLPGAGEIRVHEHFGGTSRPVDLAAAPASLSVHALAVATELIGEGVAYGRVDLMEYAGQWVVSELELTEPGLYLDVLPSNAGPFADLIVAALR